MKTFQDYLKEAENESGLQYYTGVKKHGKEYMKKAAEAGRKGASQQELGALKDKYSKAEKNKKTTEGSLSEGDDRIMFKGKEIDTDTIEYDMQDFSDMIFVTDIGVKYTDGTEVDDADMAELEELPAYIDWVYQDYNDRQADQADMYRDMQRDAGMESTNEKLKMNQYGDMEGMPEPDDKMMDLNNKMMQTKLVDALAKAANVDRKSVYFDDADLVWGSKTVKHQCLVDKECTFADAVDELKSFADANPDAESIELNRIKELAGQPDINEAVDKSALEAWYNKYSKYRGNNGDELPAGMLRGYIDTGIMTDGVEDNELEKAVKMLGGDRSKAEDELFNDDDGIFAKMLPITDAMQKEFLKIMGVSEIDEENCTEAAKILGDDIVGFGVDEGTQELDRIKELAGASIDETYDDDDAFYEAYGEMWYNEDDIVDEAEYQGRKVKLGKPMAGDVKKFKVYVKDPKTGNTKKVNFGHGGSSVKGKSMRIRKNNPGARKSFRARHNCDNPGPRTKARYWSCRKW